MAAAAPPATPPSLIADGRFELQQRIGVGAFSQVWRGRDRSSGAAVAVKVEDYEDEVQAMQLEDEAALLREITMPEKPEGFAELLFAGDAGRFYFMVCDLLGESLADLLQRAGGRFAVPVVATLAVQILSRIAWIHSKGIIHRDIKPDNFMTGLGPRANRLHLIDFGLSRRYFAKGRHIPCCDRVALKGTLRYASTNALRRAESSRRDDLESAGYLLVLLAKGSLPWSGLPAGATEEELAQRVLRAKLETPIVELCAGLPGAFARLLSSSRGLAFDARPDYGTLVDGFRRLEPAESGGRAAHLPWLVGCKPESLEPLERWREPRQPDDGERRAQRPSATASWCSFPFCCPREGYMEVVRVISDSDSDESQGSGSSSAATSRSA